MVLASMEAVLAALAVSSAASARSRASLALAAADEATLFRLDGGRVRRLGSGGRLSRHVERASRSALTWEVPAGVDWSRLARCERHRRRRSPSSERWSRHGKPTWR